MTERARQLLRRLADRGKSRPEDLGMTQTELAAAISEIGDIVDDDNHHVAIVKVTHAAELIAAVELTTPGRGLASHM